MFLPLSCRCSWMSTITSVTRHPKPLQLMIDHARDLQVQEKYGVHYLTYWLNDSEGRLFCLVEAPSIEAAIACHEEAHGLIPHNIIEVIPPSVGQFLGDWEASVPPRATVAGPGSEPDGGLRATMFTDFEASTDVSANLGDDAAMAMIHTHDEVVRDALAAHEPPRGASARRDRARSAPRSGIQISMSITSGRWVRAASTASTPVPASATTSMSF